MSNKFATALAVAILFQGSVEAQVGHPPDRSPYRDLRVSHSLVLGSGYLLGSGGKIGAGPSQGPVVGLRYSIHLGGPFEAVIGAAGASLSRPIYSNGVPSDTVRQEVLIADAGLAFLLTGRKSWRGLVPYIGATLGAAFGENVPQDTSGFTFRRRFQFGPQVGVRWYPSQALGLRFEFRDILWRLVYPRSFFVNPPNDPVLDASTDSRQQWTHNPALTLSIGFRVRS
jgi:hypothetical protein